MRTLRAQILGVDPQLNRIHDSCALTDNSSAKKERTAYQYFQDSSYEFGSFSVVLNYLKILKHR